MLTIEDTNSKENPRIYQTSLSPDSLFEGTPLSDGRYFLENDNEGLIAHSDEIEEVTANQE